LSHYCTQIESEVGGAFFPSNYSKALIRRGAKFGACHVPIWQKKFSGTIFRASFLHWNQYLGRFDWQIGKEGPL